MKSLVSPVLWVCFAMLIGMMGTALISPLYAVYRAEWDLLPSQVSLIYVIYMMGALASLLTLGRLPDKLGFRLILFVSIALSVVGTFLTLAAGGTTQLFIGRFIVGLASTMATTAGATALRQVLREHLRPRLSLIYSLVMALGFGLGPLTGGVFGQFSAHPLVTPYWPTIICGIIAFVGLWFLVPDTRVTKRHAPLSIADFVPKMTMPPANRRLAFAVACGGTFLGFSVFGLYASMVPLFVEDMMHLKGPLVSGVSIAAIFVFSAITQVSMQRVEPVRTLALGLVCFVLCSLALAVNLRLNSAVLFVIGVLLTSVGHGMSLLGSMSMLNRVATAENQAGLTSTYMVVGYVGAVLSVLGLGWGADHLGMTASVTAFCMVMVALNLCFIAASRRVSL